MYACAHVYMYILCACTDRFAHSQWDLGGNCMYMMCVSVCVDMCSYTCVHRPVCTSSMGSRTKGPVSMPDCTPCPYVYMRVCIRLFRREGGRGRGAERESKDKAREQRQRERAKTRRDTLYMRGRWKDWMPAFGTPSATNSQSSLPRSTNSQRQILRGTGHSRP